MYNFCLQHPPHKWFDPRDVDCLLSLPRSWNPDSSLTNFKLALKNITLFALCIAKHCCDLTLLCIDNEHVFLQCHDAIFVPTSSSKTDWPGHIAPQICI